MIKETEINNVIRFKDGNYLGLFGKVDRLTEAIKFNGNWETGLHMKNNPIRLSEEVYEIKTVRMDIQLID